MKTTLRLALGVACVLCIASVSWAQVSISPIPVRATIQGTNSLSVALTKITPRPSPLPPLVDDTVEEIDFGTLTYSSDLGIFTAASYYFMDVGIVSNASSWTITHYANPVAGAGTNLDTHINVSFVRQVADDDDEPLLNGKVSYAASNGKSYVKSDFPTGWLRIYYGLGTGSGDNSGVTPVPQTQAAATYQGSVYLTLTPS